jgi:hypothetical protein
METAGFSQPREYGLSRIESFLTPVSGISYGMVELSMQHSYLISSDTLNFIPSPASHTPRYCRRSRTEVEANGCSGTQYVLAYLLYSLVSIAALNSIL